MDPLTGAINKKQAQSKQESRVQPSKQPKYDMNTAKGQFNAGNDPKSAKRTTREAHRAKTSAEAEVKRKKTPPEFRAEAYKSGDSNRKSQTSSNDSLKGKVHSKFKSATSSIKEKWSNFRGKETDSSQSPSNNQQTQSRSTMSSGFNKASFEGRTQSEVNDKPSAQDRKPMNE